MVNQSTPKCSIVIRAHNEEQHIGRLLIGIMQQTVKQVEIVVVDSGSTDATVAIASRYPVKIVNIRPEEFSFGRSLNLGIEQTTSEFVVIASAHVYPMYPDWLEQLLLPFSDPQVALVYGKQRGNEISKFSERQHLANLYPEKSSPKQETPICNNANAAIRSNLWHLQPYDEEIPALEDIAWASWALNQGYCLAYTAEAEVIHVHDETPRQVYNRYRREAMALKIIQPDEQFGFLDLIRLYLSNVASDMWHATSKRDFGRNLWQILWFRWMQFWGTYRGFAISGPLTGQLKRTFFYPRGFNRSTKDTQRTLKPIDYSRSSIGTFGNQKD